MLAQLEFGQHLIETLPKDALVQLALQLATERNIARTDAATADAEARRWKRRAIAYRGAASLTGAEQVRAEAQAILDTIEPDPDADDHLAELAAAIGPRATPSSRPRKAGPRCRKGVKFCGKPLDEHGLCSRHDYAARAAMRAA